MEACKVIAVSALGILALTSAATAALIEYAWAPGLVYDSDQDLTWLKDGSAQAEPMNWYETVTWAETVEVVSGGVTYDTWRLPVTTDNQAAAVGEWGYLYTEYGVDKDDQSPFTNLTSEYWASPQFRKSDPYADPPYSEIVNVAYTFKFTPGSWATPVQFWQKTDDPDFRGYENYVWPVFDGAPVPEPASMGLLGLGVLTLLARRRRS